MRRLEDYLPEFENCGTPNPLYVMAMTGMIDDLASQLEQEQKKREELERRFNYYLEVRAGIKVTNENVEDLSNIKPLNPL